MKIIHLSLTEKINEVHDINLCLGYFDALHIGHQALIKKAKKDHRKVGLMTFDVLPNQILGKKSTNASISSLFDKKEILEKLNVDYFFILHFDEEVRELSPENFIMKVLKAINPSALYVGSDYRFGKNASGDIKTLQQYFPTHVISLLTDDGKKVSSSDIANFISNGEIQKANYLLGRNYSITGLVVEGNHNGTKIGFPTCNLSLSYSYVLPQIGVYIGKIKFLDYEYYGIISVSTHPTIMELKSPIIEVNIYDYSGNLYGKEISVEFIERIGEIQKFNSLEELKKKLQTYKDYLMKNYIK